MASRRCAALAVSRGRHPVEDLSASGYRQPNRCPKARITQPNRNKDRMMTHCHFFRFSDSFFNVLLTFARQHQILLPDPQYPTVLINTIDPDCANRVGRALFLAHAEPNFLHHSMNLEWILELSRYNQQAREYVFRPDIRLRALNSYQSIAIIKATHTYERHVRSSAAYANSPAALIVRALREGACFHLPAYEAAPSIIGDAPADLAE